jgi:hypothetical protein
LLRGGCAAGESETALLVPVPVLVVVVVVVVVVLATSRVSRVSGTKYCKT